jgi:hypothetical protein
MCLDEDNMQLWFSTTNDSSLKCLDLIKRKFNNKCETNVNQPDYELDGLPWINDYYMLKNKRYVITNDSENIP